MNMPGVTGICSGSLKGFSYSNKIIARARALATQAASLPEVLRSKRRVNW